MTGGAVMMRAERKLTERKGGIDYGYCTAAGPSEVDQGGAGALCGVLAGTWYGSGQRRRIHLPGSDGRGLFHRQERLDAGALRLDFLLSVPSVRREGRMACGQQELHRLSGGALRQPRRGRAAVFHRYRRGKAPAPAPLLLLRGVLRPGQRGILRRYRPAGAPGARPGPTTCIGT